MIYWVIFKYFSVLTSLWPWHLLKVKQNLLVMMPQLRNTSNFPTIRSKLRSESCGPFFTTNFQTSNQDKQPSQDFFLFFGDRKGKESCNKGASRRMKLSVSERSCKKDKESEWASEYYVILPSKSERETRNGSLNYSFIIWVVCNHFFEYTDQLVQDNCLHLISLTDLCHHL